MKFSIIVPIYNREKNAKECITNLMRLNYDDYEVIVVDDGSTDNTLEICKSMTCAFPKLKVIHEKNCGPLKARYNGFLNSRGDYILFVDSDDELDFNALSIIDNYIYVTKPDIIQYNYKRTIGEKTLHIKTCYKYGEYDRRRLENEIFPTMIYKKGFFEFGIMPSLCNKAFKRSILNSTMDWLPSNLNYGEDGIVTYQCFIKCQNLLIIQDELYNYINTPDSTCNTNYHNIAAQNFVLDKQYNILFKKNILKKIEQQICGYFTYMTYIAFNEIANELCIDGINLLSIHSYRKRLSDLMNDSIKKKLINSSFIDTSVREKIYIWCLKHRVFSPLLLHQIIIFKKNN